jgi:hypothetical protein
MDGEGVARDQQADLWQLVPAHIGPHRERLGFLVQRAGGTVRSNLHRRVFDMRCLASMACVDRDRSFDIMGIHFDESRVSVHRQQ